MNNKIATAIFLFVGSTMFGDQTYDVNGTIETCKLVSEEAFGYTGDVSGKRLYTKKQYNYECTRVEEEKGSCKTLKAITEELDLGQMRKIPVYYETENFEGSMGQMLAVTQAYDKINGMWAGWHGICQDGMDDDNFDWMTDPYVLAGFAMDALSAGFAAETSSAKQALKEAADKTKSAVSDEINKAVQELAKKKAQESMVKMAVCATSAGLDITKMVKEYLDDGEPCDPVDEICGEEENGASDDGNIFTISADEYENMLAANPDMLDYVQIIDGEGTDVLSVKISSSTRDISDLSMEEAKKEREEMKLKQLKYNAVMTVLQTASCMASGSASKSNSDDDSSFTSTENLTGMALGAINPLLGMASSIAFKTYESLQPIDTCRDEDDAKEKGSRHEATYNALKYGFCHLIEKNTKGNILTEQTKYRYCCYNDKTTRVIVEQAKAQLGKKWEHCTDISPNELSHLSFKSCDPEGLDSGINGVYLDAYASDSERAQAYQFVNHCIDTREYIRDMMNKFGGENMMLDKSQLEEMLEDFK